MSSIPSNALGLIQLSVLLLSCITVFSTELDAVSWVVPPAYHHHAPIYPPVESPKHPKAYPPSHHHHHYHKAPPPSHPPAKPPTPSHDPPIFPPPTSTRKLVAVQGVVYCKSCIYTGRFSSWKASPIAGAVVKLQCKNTRYRQILKAKTDKNGYFFIPAPKTVTTYGAHKCTVSLVSSPSRCNKPTNINRGIDGAMLIYRERPRVPPLPFELYNVGPFAFESSSKKVKCPP